MSLSIFKYILVLMLVSVMAPSWGQTDTICQANPLGNYHVIGEPGSTFFWDTQGDGEIVSGQGNDSVRIVWNDTPGVYRLLVTEISAEGCVGDPRQLSVLVLNPGLSQLGQALCAPDRNTWQIQLLANGSPGSVNAGVLSHVEGSVWLVDQIPAGIHLRVQVNLGDCASFFDFTAPDCSCPPIHASITGDTAICQADTLILTAGGGSYYLWNTGDTTSSIKVSPAVDSVFTVLVSEGVCADSVQTEVRVYPLPWVSAGKDTTVVFGSRVYLEASAEQEVVWEPALYLDCPECLVTSALPLASITYCLSIQNQYGCKATDCVQVLVDTICDGLFLPNVFAPSPGGHQANDCLRLYGTNCLAEMSLSIYSRWGEKVYQSHQVSECWDGTFRGEPLNAGVFVYQLEARLITGELVHRQGNITLIR